jgi:DNA-cytosine methyltransferase
LHDLTHASFFSGVGGLDLGLERAGWRTVSFSEVDPYASAVLAERWLGVPNAGDIVALARDGYSGESRPSRLQQPEGGRLGHAAGASLWSGGFPCQDLSVAGKRAGFAGERSSLAFAFLDLVERHRPPAILLENVPGLLSSNGGKDFGALLSRLGQLGYGWAYRVLDAQFFGVPQRRRRVFICAFHAGAGLGADSAAAVLSVGTRCDGHSQTSDEAGERASGGSGGSVAPPVRAGGHGDPGIGRDNDHDRLIVSPSPDPGGVREADGLAGRLDDREVVAPILSGSGGQRTTDLNTPLVYRKSARVSTPGTDERWVDDGLANTLNNFDVGDVRTTHAVVRRDDRLDASGEAGGLGGLLPLGLDSHRYRCCGNGVVSNVSEWIGHRLAEAMA